MSLTDKKSRGFCYEWFYVGNENCQMLEMKLFVEIVKDIKYFRKKRYLRSSIGFLISLNPLSANTDKMVRHTQKIRQQLANELFECVWPFYGTGPQRYKGFMALHLTLEHLKYCLNTSRVDMKPCYPLKTSLLLFIEILSIQFFRNCPFPINTTFETIKREF